MPKMAAARCSSESGNILPGGAVHRIPDRPWNPGRGYQWEGPVCVEEHYTPQMGGGRGGGGGGGNGPFTPLETREVDMTTIRARDSLGCSHNLLISNPSVRPD